MNGNIKPSDEGYDINCPWDASKLAVYRWNYNQIILEKYADQASTYTRQILDASMGMGSPWIDSTSPEPLCYPNILNDIKHRLSHILEEFGYAEDLEEVVARFDYIPDPFLPYQERTETRHKRMSSVIEKSLDYEISNTFELDW